MPGYGPCVSSRAPVWGASRDLNPCSTSLKFQVVPPCGGHHPYCRKVQAGKRFQVVPPCGGHPAQDKYNQLKAGFKSCPRVGGILDGSDEKLDELVSSRAPVWGASLRFLHNVFCRNGFKSCPRVGGISPAMNVSGVYLGFKSCPRVGGIRTCLKVLRPACLFQVVPPCGGHPY